MPVQPGEVLFYLSNPYASVGYSGIGTPGASLGGWMSTTQVASAIPLDDLFLDISGAQNAGGQIDYQCVFIMNATATGLPMNSIYLWLPVQDWTYGGAGMAVGIDPTGPVPYNSSSQQAVKITNATTAPAGVNTWSAGPHSVFTAGAQSGALQPNYCMAVWLQRTAMNTPILTPQLLSLQCTYESPA